MSKLWGIDLNNSSLYYLFGNIWRKIDLKCKRAVICHTQPFHQIADELKPNESNEELDDTDVAKRDSQIFIKHQEKIDININTYFEGDIFDTDLDSHLNPSSEIESNSFNQQIIQKSQNTDNEIDLDKYMMSKNDFDSLITSNDGSSIDEFIEKFKEKDFIWTDRMNQNENDFQSWVMVLKVFESIRNYQCFFIDINLLIPIKMIT